MAEARGQGMAIDMMFAVFILFLVLAGLLQVWNNNTDAITEEELLRALQRKASRTMDILVRTEGTPPNWETLPVSDISSIGLATSDRVIDETKLNAFKNLTASYDETREIFKLGTFHYFFSLEGVDDVNAGLATSADAYKVTVMRIVNYKGEEANAKLTIYSLR